MDITAVNIVRLRGSMYHYHAVTIDADGMLFARSHGFGTEWYCADENRRCTDREERQLDAAYQVRRVLDAQKSGQPDAGEDE